MKPLFEVTGLVTHGQNRGKTLGYPTANIPLTFDIPEGIYAALTKVNGKDYQSATFVGSAKTFNETEKRIEAFLLDFEGDLYEQEITIQLFKKIRDNQAFSSADELVKQMDEDVKNVRNFFSNLN